MKTLSPRVPAFLLLPLALTGISQAQNEALYMDGNLGGVDVPGSPSLDVQPAYTFEAWVKYEGGHGIVFRKDGYNTLPFQFSGTSTQVHMVENWVDGFQPGHWCDQSIPGPAAGPWTHVAASFDGTVLTLYRNGAAVQSCAMPQPFSNVGIPLRIGWCNSIVGGVHLTKGWLDEVRIWNVALNQQQIVATINKTIDAAQVANYPGLVACWNFEGNSNDATGVNHGATFGTATYLPATNIPVLDCDGNGLLDSIEIATGTALDCNGNGIIDACDIASGTSADCDANGIPDSCDLASGAGVDCNSNGIIDSCDIASGTSLDPNGNGIPEECESSITSYCSPAAPNSVSLTGSHITAQGIPSTLLNNLVFTVSSLPPHKPGLFIYGPFQNHLPAGNGFVCLGGVVQRVAPALLSSPQGTVNFPVDLTQFPFTGGSNTIHPGSTWNFQFWHRDPTGGLFAFNFSDAVQLTFAP